MNCFVCFLTPLPKIDIFDLFSYIEETMILPLYSNIIKHLPKRDLDKVGQENLINEISKCSINEMEIIYALILSYCTAENIPVLFYPFGSIKKSDGIEFNLANLPVKLQNILNKFVCKIRWTSEKN